MMKFKAEVRHTYHDGVPLDDVWTMDDRQGKTVEEVRDVLTRMKKVIKVGKVEQIA